MQQFQQPQHTWQPSQQFPLNRRQFSQSSNRSQFEKFCNTT
jgi:hypothetical protein